MATPTEVVEFLLRDATRDAGEDIATLAELGDAALHELCGSGKVSKAARAEIDGQAGEFLARLQATGDPEIEARLAKATVKADAPRLRSAETLILATGAAAALLVFVLRFSEIDFDGKSLKIKALDNAHNSKNIRAMFEFMRKIVPFMGGDPGGDPGAGDS